jgi:hypothetical protein
MRIVHGMSWLNLECGRRCLGQNADHLTLIVWLNNICPLADREARYGSCLLERSNAPLS